MTRMSKKWTRVGVVRGALLFVSGWVLSVASMHAVTFAADISKNLSPSCCTVFEAAVALAEDELEVTQGVLTDAEEDLMECEMGGCSE